MNILPGYKSYIIAALGVGYQVYNTYANKQPLDLNALMGFLGLAAVRNAIPKK